MGGTTRFLLLILLIDSPACVVFAENHSLQEIVLADELRTAFYERAPAPLAATMSSAVRLRCMSSAPDTETVPWLCSGRLVYLRSVYVNGARGRHGLVCANDGTSTLKYFGTDLVAEVVAHGSCVRAEFDGNTYKLHVESVRGGGT